MRKIILLLFAFVFIVTATKAQTQHQNIGWLLMMNSTKFNAKWGMHVDVQVRSAANFDHVRNLIFRPGLTYYLNNNNNLTVGYSLIKTNNQSATGVKSSVTENRIWEQYIHTHKIKSVLATQRLRLEQRFVGQNNGDEIFAQRFRYFVRLVKPIQKPSPSFTKGAFLALQNEVFFNVQHKTLLNNSFFDQNRAYVALGYRFSKKLDIETGYMNQAIHGLHNNSVNNVLQLAVYTRF